MTISSASFDALYEQPQNLFVFVTMKGGVRDGEHDCARGGARGRSEREAADREAVQGQPDGGSSSVLNVLYVLLALSIVVSLFGIVNTLVLSVFERTRELGMLRALGMTRWQVRWMISLESVITALMGARSASRSASSSRRS